MLSSSRSLFRDVKKLAPGLRVRALDHFNPSTAREKRVPRKQLQLTLDVEDGAVDDDSDAGAPIEEEKEEGQEGGCPEWSQHSIMMIPFISSPFVLLYMTYQFQSFILLQHNLKARTVLRRFPAPIFISSLVHLFHSFQWKSSKVTFHFYGELLLVKHFWGHQRDCSCVWHHHHCCRCCGHLCLHHWRCVFLGDKLRTMFL